MLPSRSISGFVVRFLLLYGVLVALWPMLSSGYASLFRSGGELVLGRFGSGGLVRFRDLPQPEGMDDTRILLKARGSHEWTWMKLSTRHVGFTSTAVLVALVLATPVPWRRRARALLWAMLLIHLFITLRLLIMIAFGMSLNESGADALPDSFLARCLAAGSLSVSVGQGLSYIAPVLIWVLVALPAVLGQKGAVMAVRK